MAHQQRPARVPFKLTVLAAQAACACAAVTPVSMAWAQAAPAAEAAETSQTITVTARKREERGQDVPQSLNVFSGAALEASGVTQLDELQFRTPGLKVTAALGSFISIRGVSNNASPRGGSASTAVHLDGVYLPRPEMALNEVFDLNRIEVLKGPEGTLYGRNATAGVINYLSRDPGRGTGFDGFVGGGSFGLLRAQAGGNVALGEGMALRISGVHSKDDGYTKNIGSGGGEVDARDFSAVRLKGLFTLTRDVQLRLTVQASDDAGTLGLGASHNPETTNAYVFRSGAPLRESPRRIRLDTAPDVSKRGTLVSATTDAALGGGLSLKSITGLVNYTSRSAADADGVGGFIENSAALNRSRFLSQELQLSGSAGRAFSWTSGLYVSQEKTSGNQQIVDSESYPADLTPLPLFGINFNSTARNAALFGEGTWQFNDKLSLLVGARYSRERQQGVSDGFVLDFSTFRPQPFGGDRSITSSRFTPKALVQYKFDRNTMAYASVTTGFKSGGINFNAPVVTYKPEKITSYEVGTKLVRGGGALELDVAAFYYDYSDLQLRTVVGNQTPISNVAKSTIQGLEFTLVARPLRDLSFDLNAAYVDSELKNYISPATRTDLSGAPLPMTPKASATAGAEYRFSVAGGSLSLRGEVNHQSTVIFPAFQNTAIERQEGVTLVNANLRYTFAGGGTYLALIGRNLTDKTYMSNRNFARGFYDLQTFAAPRTVELRLGTRF